MPTHPTGPSHEDTRRTLIQFVRSAGFAGRIAATSHSIGDTEVLLAAGSGMVLGPFQDAADRAVELLCGAEEVERTVIPQIAAEGRDE